MSKPEKPKVEKPVKPHLSASQIGLYNKCGEAYRRRYIEKHIIPPGAAMIRGTAVHAGAEFNFGQKVESKVDLPAGQVVERAADAVEQKVKNEGIELTAEEKTVGKDKVVGAIKDSAVALTAVLMTDIAPAILPVGVEERVRIELPNATRDLLAILDIRTVDTVEDLKTGAKLKGKAVWQDDTQMTMYALTHRALTGKDPRVVRVHELVATKTPKAVTHDLSYDNLDFEPLVRRINATLNGIEAGIFTPATPGGWWCSAKWCGYHGDCPYVNGQRKAAGEMVE